MSREVAQYGKCPVCGYLMLPVLELSPCGHDGPPELLALDEEGVVYSWTRVGGGETSRLMAMVDFLGGELRVTAPVTGAESISIGDRVLVSVGEDTPFTLHPVG
jgi:uncharacterized OB-fold protein